MKIAFFNQNMQACTHSISPTLLTLNTCISPIPAMYIKFNNASVINQYQEADCTTQIAHFSLDTNTCHYLGASDYAMVLYTMDNYTVTMAKVNPNNSSSNVNQVNIYLLIMVIILIIF
jgi:hypothetical protein